MDSSNMFICNKPYHCRNTIVEIKASSFGAAFVVDVAGKRARDKKHIQFDETKRSTTGNLPQTAPNIIRRLKYIARFLSIAGRRNVKMRSF